MELAWITPKWPLPVIDGARQATAQLLKSLSRRGVTIDLCSIVPEAEWDNKTDLIAAAQELEVRSIRVVFRRKKLAHVFLHPLTPVTFVPFIDHQVKVGCEQFLAERRQAVVVYDGLHAAVAADSSDVHTTAYRAHNVESEIWFRAARDSYNPLKKLFVSLQGALVFHIENKIVNRSDIIFPVSDRDADQLIKRVPGCESCVLPIGLDTRFKAVEKAPASGKNVLFVGRLDWAPNRDGLKWFLDRVWQQAHARDPRLNLTVVGSGDGSWLESYRPMKGVSILGQVPDLKGHYAKSLVSIIPIFYGSGTRVKAIEASLHQRACISTAVGMEGIRLRAGQDFYLAETENDWIETLVGIEETHALQLGADAAIRVSLEHDPDAIAARFFVRMNKFRPIESMSA